MISRRDMLKLISVSGAGILTNGFKLENFYMNEISKRKIPSTGELLPVVGLGTWQTFDVGSNDNERKQLKEVLTLMKEKGGTVIDSSPMYGTSEEVVGNLTTELKIQNHFFYATIVWTSGRYDGINQM